VYLATDRATVLQRIAARAAQDGDDFKISTELAAFYFDHFEVPAAATHAAQPGTHCPHAVGAGGPLPWKPACQVLLAG
jgi:hypothetical protein